ncbi:MAG: aminopeptidase, partial [Chloroflexi bacterium]|nr:aminopeptidase [Chloroflexota bacterium]MCI0794798.1 aminopeptidase [Chloroflexota bacterium]MCI0800219.1 aminopeptidase [Chloroflexota bacterium]MCI0859837.1 aminopeptidase [Chloroflexota bacterium]MCI0867687.1 aminopeptidase [Chloroflexota bacterium]
MDTEQAVRTAGMLTPEDLDDFRRSFDSDSTKQLMQNVVTQRDVNEVALNRSIVAAAPHTFSTVLDDWTVTNQAKSGRCWMFAGLNLCRVETRDMLNLKEFEFSQNYIMFWDKMERANYLLEAIIETADQPVDDRTVAWLLQSPISDGGQWDMFAALVKKHGVVPKSAMTETESSSNSSRMNSILNYQIRQGAKKIRDSYAQESGLDEMRRIKNQALQVIHHVLCIHLGTPPSRFDWQWKDKDGKFTRDGEMTPLEFAKKYVATPLEEYVCLVHDPRESSPMGRTFTVAYLGNVVDAPPIKYLNVDISVMKDITLRMLQDGKPVWMGCDTGKQMHRDLGLWDSDLFDYEGVYGADFDLDKAARLEYHQT